MSERIHVRHYRQRRERPKGILAIQSQSMVSGEDISAEEENRIAALAIDIEKLMDEAGIHTLKLDDGFVILNRRKR